MRSDAFDTCNNPYKEELKKISSYTLTGDTVFPSVTLPCHMSLFHSVEPMRHGIITNEYVSQVHEIKGLFEVLKDSGKNTAMFFSWGPLRDVARPASLTYSTFCFEKIEDSDEMMTCDCERIVEEREPDFVFFYLHNADSKGHKSGWMGEEYMQAVCDSLSRAKRIIDKFSSKYDVIITADHGGHDRMHGTREATDMIIPMFFIGESFEKGKDLGKISILDIAPTITKLMEVPSPDDWEGKPLV